MAQRKIYFFVFPKSAKTIFNKELLKAKNRFSCFCPILPFFAKNFKKIKK
jgi:hypothetical protein